MFYYSQCDPPPIQNVPTIDEHTVLATGSLIASTETDISEQTHGNGY